MRLAGEEADKGVEVAQLVQNKVHRKTLKQTIMTQVYGVTMYGGKEQILGKGTHNKGMID